MAWMLNQPDLKILSVSMSFIVLLPKAINKLIMQKTQIKLDQSHGLFQDAWLFELDEENISKGYYYLPDNYAELLVVLEGTMVRKVIGTPQKTVLKEKNIYLASLRSRGVIFHANNDVKFLVLKVCPQARLSSFDQKFSETRNHVVKLKEDLLMGAWSYSPKRLIKRLAEGIEDHMEMNDELVSQCIALIKDNRGAIKVKDLYDTVGVCKSTLEDRFQKVMGLSPKEFCKIEKLNQFMENFYSHEDMSLTQLTFKSGYYDQSHLIKEFKYFVDVSPRKYLREALRLDTHVEAG